MYQIYYEYLGYPSGYDEKTFRVHDRVGEAVKWWIISTGYAAPDEEDRSPLQERRMLSTDGSAAMDDFRREAVFDYAVEWALNELEVRYEGYRNASVEGVPWAILAPAVEAPGTELLRYVVMGESGYSGGYVPPVVATMEGTEFRPYSDTYENVGNKYLSIDKAVAVVTDRMGGRAPAAVTPGRSHASPWLGEIHAYRGDEGVWVRPMCWRGLHGAASLEEAAAGAAEQVEDFLSIHADIEPDMKLEVAGRLYRFGGGPDRLGDGCYERTDGQMWEVAADGGLSRWDDPFRAVRDRGVSVETI